MVIAKELEKANDRGVGQFHIVEFGHITGTWRSFGSACLVAEKYGAKVCNSFGEIVYPTDGT